MQLRTSRVLKLLAILIFTLESLAPSAFAGTFASEEPIACHQTQKLFTTHTLPISIFEEESDVEERNNGGYEMAVTTLPPSFALSTLLESKLTTSSIHFRNCCLSGSTPLIQLHCRYRL